MRDMVTITCYNRTETLSRKDAQNKYLEAFLWSDGSERERYANILIGLQMGLSEVSDE